MRVRYVLNSAVLTNPGVYRYELMNRDEAAAWIRRGSFASRVGYPATAQHIAALGGVPVPISREPHRMEIGDEALVVRLRYRLDNPAAKGLVEPKEEDWEYGLLVREQ